MKILHRACRIIDCHLRQGIASSNWLLPISGQITCCHGYHGARFLSHPSDHTGRTNSGSLLHCLSDLDPKQSRYLQTWSNNCVTSQGRTHFEHFIQNDLKEHVVCPMNKFQTKCTSRRFKHPVHGFHSVCTPTPSHVLQSHPLFTTVHERNQGRQFITAVSRSILEASPSKVQSYLKLIRFDKPIGTYLLFWPCTWSIAMAASPGHFPDPYFLCMFGAGAFLMRGAGCIINDLWDQDFDKKVERTKTRPLAAGELTPFQALTFLGTQLSLALLILVQFNLYSIVLGAASMGLVIVYPLAKRFTYWPQIVLGFTFNYGAILGWSAVTGASNWSVVLPLYIGGLFWTLVYDTIYAHQDKYDDLMIGVKSTALKLGEKTKPWLAAFSSVMVSCLAVSGYMCDQTWPFYAGLSLTATHLAHQLYTVDLDNPDDCAAKFKANSQVGIIMFLAIMAGTLLKKQKNVNTTDDLAPVDT